MLLPAALPVKVWLPDPEGADEQGTPGISHSPIITFCGLRKKPERVGNVQSWLLFLLLYREMVSD